MSVKRSSWCIISHSGKGSTFHVSSLNISIIWSFLYCWQVTATYRPGLPPVLREVSFHLPAGTSCGLVGRTGSGKSSLMLALFRLISVDSGRILLDGIDVASIGLDGLRRQLAIIPQVSTGFSLCQAIHFYNDAVDIPVHNRRYIYRHRLIYSHMYGKKTQIGFNYSLK